MSQTAYTSRRREFRFCIRQTVLDDNCILARLHSTDRRKTSTAVILAIKIGQAISGLTAQFFNHGI